MDTRQDLCPQGQGPNASSVLSMLCGLADTTLHFFVCEIGKIKPSLLVIELEIICIIVGLFLGLNCS